MSIENKHPEYIETVPDWELMIHSHQGQRMVKEQGARYLPPTAGMRANGYGNAVDAPGQVAYDAYRLRALYHNFVRDAISGLLGIMHRKPPVIEVPRALEPMLDNATIAGESLTQLWRRVSESQLLLGRCGLLTDVPNGATVSNAMPYIAIYGATTIINWDVGMRIQGRQSTEVVVLDESSWERAANLAWVWRRQYRILARDNVAMQMGVIDQSFAGDGRYVVAVLRDGQDVGGTIDLTGAKFDTPSVAGQPIDEIPFVFINTNDLVASPCQPPFIGLANLSMAMYRGEADYRQSLFMQGQDTLVRIGGTEDQVASMSGVGAVMDLPMGGDAKYVGVQSMGLAEQRQALENDKKQAAEHAIQMLDTKSSQAESGEALRVRVASRTATLATIQIAAAGGIADALWHAGRFMGLDESELEKIVVEPNLDFSEASVETNDVLQLINAIVAGAPLSMESYHEWLRDRDFTDKTFEDEMQKIDEEKAAGQRDFGTADINIDPATGEPIPAGIPGKPKAFGAPAGGKLQ